ncbi:MAG: DinB family protein [Planctomycetes bacterium]|nr:DinB family protein [Planctomycetota bacterium]
MSVAPEGTSGPAALVRRPLAGEVGDYYLGYVALAPAGDALAELERGLAETRALLARFGEKRGGHRYAPGKWSVKEIVGHVIDAERVFSYRALRMARGDATPLAGFEQDDFVAAAHFDRRTLADLVAELEHLRAANLRFFRSLEPADWERRGTASDNPFVVCAFPYILAGHEAHHRRVLAERYLPG